MAGLKATKSSGLEVCKQSTAQRDHHSTIFTDHAQVSGGSQDTEFEPDASVLPSVWGGLSFFNILSTEND